MHPVICPKKFRYWFRDVTLWSHICRCVLFSKAHSRDVEEARCCRPSAGGAPCWSSLLHSRLQHAIFKVDFFLYRKPVKVILCATGLSTKPHTCVVVHYLWYPGIWSASTKWQILKTRPGKSEDESNSKHQEATFSLIVASWCSKI